MNKELVQALEKLIDNMKNVIKKKNFFRIVILLLIIYEKKIVVYLKNRQ